jgi:pimeloyl-ACP methyl ester carboxylesterase
MDVDGIRTRYYTAGQGEPLVLLHGGHFAFVDSLDCFSLNFPELQQHFRVLAPDKLGQGHTDNPPSDAEYTFEAMYQHLVRWLELLGVKQAHVLGHSRGGLPVALLALDHPELVRSVIIVDSSTLAPHDPRYPGGVFYDEIEQRIPPGLPTRETVRMEPDENSFSTAHVTDDWLDRYMQIALLPKQLDAKERMKTLGPSVWMPSMERNKQRALDVIDQRGLPVPTLVVWGFNDPSAPLPLGRSLFTRIAARTPNAEFHVLNQAGHYTFREHPREFNRLLRAFCLE